MKKLFFLVPVVAAIATALALPANADDIAVTVQVCTISPRVNDNSVTYGSLPFSANAGSPTKKNTVVGDANGGALETQTVFNDGSCPANVLISSSDAVPTSAGTNWDLATCATIDLNVYGHQYELGNVGSVFNGVDMTNAAADTGIDLSPGDGLDGSGTDQTTLDLGICMPTSGDANNKTITVTVLMTAQ
jgi:hypothetical protein